MRKMTAFIEIMHRLNTLTACDRQEPRFYLEQASALGPRRTADEEAVTLTSQSRAADSL